MRKRLFVVAIVILLFTTVALPALAAPKDAYTKTDLENEVTNGNLIKLWVTDTLMMQAMQNGKLQKSDDMLIYGEAVYCEDTAPVNGYVLVYYYRWGYNTKGEVACYLKATGYVPANCLTDSQPSTDTGYSYGGGESSDSGNSSTG